MGSPNEDERSDDIDGPPIIKIADAPLLAAWKKVDRHHPLFDEGIAIISEILKSPIEEIPLLRPNGRSGTSMFMKTPEEEHVYGDLISKGGIYVDMTANTIEPMIETAKFLCSLAKQPAEQYINAIGIPATEDGLLKCQPIRIAALEALKPSYELQDECIKTNSCYSPAGAITDAHIDSALLGTVVTVWSGKKIWITWPPTSTNLEAFTSKHFHDNRRDLTLTISTLENMKVCLLNAGDTIYMPAGTIHAVLTPERSTLTSAFVALGQEMVDGLRQQETFGLLLWVIEQFYYLEYQQ